MRRRFAQRKPNNIIQDITMKKTILALALAAGFTSFAGSAKAQALDAAITTSAYRGLVSFNADGSTNAITTSGETLPSIPTALAFDSTDNLFIGTSGGTIRQMTPDGTVSRFSQSFLGTGSFSGVNALAFQPQLVPEPSTYALLLISGAASLWALRRRKS